VVSLWESFPQVNPPRPPAAATPPLEGIFCGATHASRFGLPSVIPAKAGIQARPTRLAQQEDENHALNL